MSRSTIAAVLSFVLPGAGLWYLNHRGRAAMNLIAAAFLTVLGAMSQREHVHYLFLAIAAGSAGYAHAVARGTNDTD